MMRYAIAVVLVLAALFASSAALAGCRDAWRQSGPLEEPDRLRRFAAATVAVVVVLITVILLVVVIGWAAA